MKNNIKSYDSEGLATLMADLGQPRFRAKQLIQWLYTYGVTTYQDMTNFPLTLRNLLEERYTINAPHLLNTQTSRDGTCKYLFSFDDHMKVETVAIPSCTSQSSSQTDRLTVCVSTQVGCAMGCVFCATGKEGFSRNLLPGEIVDQVLFAQSDKENRVSNVVTMGQGEPFLNYDNTLAALRFLNDSQGLAIGARHITLSTCGIPEGIRRLAHEPEQFTLAVSLHAADQGIRDQLMPKLSSIPLTTLKKTLIDYVALTNRRVTLEYTLINQVNDTAEARKALIDFCKGLLCHVNLLPINAVKGSTFTPSTPSTLNTWLDNLSKAHIPTTVRHSRGSDINGACGQLKNSL